jgi:hypothetical protein
MEGCMSIFKKRLALYEITSQPGNDETHAAIFY